MKQADPLPAGRKARLPFEITADAESEEDGREIEFEFRDESSNGPRIVEVEGRSPSEISLAKARWFLCASQFCYYVSEMAWTFGAAVWMAQLEGDDASLFWISAYQATARILVLILVPKLSPRIDLESYQNSDNTNFDGSRRSRLLTAWIVGQHSFVLVTILLVAGTFKLQQSASAENENLADAGRVLTCVCGGLAQVLHNVLAVAIERDWLVALAEEAQKQCSNVADSSPPSNSGGNDSANTDSDQVWLKDTNVRLRQIYLSCEILGPLLMGHLLTLRGGESLWILFGLKGSSMVLVALSMRMLCSWVPALQDEPRKPPRRLSPTIAHVEPGDDNEENTEGLFRGETLEDSSSPSRSGGFCPDLALYFSQKGLLGAGVALALLYANVLTLGEMMVAYLTEVGGGTSAAASVGFWKALSNGAAIAGTLWFRKSSLTINAKGLVSLSIMAACLTLSMAGVWMGRHALSASGSASLSGIGSILVIAGVVPSRFGLWGYDLSVTQLFQTHVVRPARGRVGGTQTVLNNVMEFVPFILGMTLLSRVSDFWVLMILGYACVGLALVAYFVGTYRTPPAQTPYGRVVKEESGES